MAQILTNKSNWTTGIEKKKMKLIIEVIKLRKMGRLKYIQCI